MDEVSSKQQRKRSQTSAESRMARLRERRRRSGEMQVTAFLDAEASDLLRQMLRFKDGTQRELLSDAVRRLAYNYDYWECERDGYDPWWEDSHVSLGGDLVERTNFRAQKIPPWIVEEERRIAGELKAWERSSKDHDDGLAVYAQRGYDAESKRNR